jgi:hypothetical protein
MGKGTLHDAFRFSDLDLEGNRAGRLSVAQISTLDNFAQSVIQRRTFEAIMVLAVSPFFILFAEAPWWFTAGLLLFVAALVYGLGRWRAAQVRRAAECGVVQAYSGKAKLVHLRRINQHRLELEGHSSVFFRLMDDDQIDAAERLQGRDVTVYAVSNVPVIVALEPVVM